MEAEVQATPTEWGHPGAEPVCPYPGLRPFQELESLYFYGRQSQIGEIISRLRATQFVAVVGGSGSGKSSLILAGTVPELRTYALARAGDFWIPIVSTPGTNHPSGVTPITRFAARFCDALTPLPEAEAAERLDGCAGILRAPDGFGEIVDRYGPQLADTAGIDPRKARFLLVIDQFEEIFHPSSRGVADCDELVYRVLDNFRHPHPRVFVVITMRSEHLSDCARYLELPDAINRASYLVRRLDEEQLEEAIAKPALRYLRLQARRQQHRRRQPVEASQVPSLPSAVEFVETVRRRLLRDTEALCPNPDHLPLLQHLLFRLWDVASARAASTGLAVPAQIDDGDLARAVQAVAWNAEPAPLPDSVNCLLECLERWATRLYESRTDSDQRSIERVFRLLAFKEPNTGTYTQQRVTFGRLRELLLLDDDAELRRLVEPWLTPHYLFWDADSSTLKVAHESFIRGWSEFRRWIDHEARLFDEYVRLLDDCRQWREHPKAPGTLIPRASLRRLREGGLLEALENHRKKQRLDALLELHRDSERLRTAVPHLRDFVATSVRYQDRTGGVILGLVVLAAVFSGLFVLERRLSDKENLLRRAYTLPVETLLATDYSFADADEPHVPLRTLLTSTEQFGQAVASPLDLPTRWFWPTTRISTFQRFAGWAEMRNATALRGMLGWSLWRVAAPRKGETAGQGPAPTPCETVLESDGTSWAPSTSRQAAFYARRTTPEVGVVVRDMHPAGFVEVFTARRAAGACRLLSLVVSVPPSQDARIAIDADVEHVFVANSATGAEGNRRLTRHAIGWMRGPAEGRVSPPMGVFRNADLAKQFWQGKDQIVRLPSVRREESNATDVRLGEEWFRIFAIDPLVLSNVAAGSWRELASATPKSPCDRLLEKITHDQSRETPAALSIYALPGNAGCVLHAALGQSLAQVSLLSVYRGRGIATAVMPETGFGPGDIDRISIGTGSGFDGWIAVHRKDGGQWLATPWQLDAWRRLACSVIDTQAADSRASARYTIPYDMMMGGAAWPDKDTLCAGTTS